MRVEGIQGAYLPPKGRRGAGDGVLGVRRCQVWPDLVKRDFQPDGPNRSVVLGHEADPDRRGRAAPGQRAGLLQPQDRRLGDRARSPTRRSLPDALRIVVSQRRPGDELIHHADRGGTPR